uniref:Uncharacterized protein n=1 Tax=Rhinolophus ferrumequinum TaxID=59479 RepID=A0A671DXJ4_RHIFE
CTVSPAFSGSPFLSALLPPFQPQRYHHCYTCSSAKPCYPVPTECQHDEAVASVLAPQLIGCLPTAQCPLPGHATYCACPYALRHHCCLQDVSNPLLSINYPLFTILCLFWVLVSILWSLETGPRPTPRNCRQIQHHLHHLGTHRKNIPPSEVAQEGGPGDYEE